MKKAVIILSTILFIASCVGEITPPCMQTVVREFIAGFEDVTRTSVDEAGKVDWSAGDMISYYSSPGGTIRQIQVQDDCHSVSFNATTRKEDNFIIAVYGGTISNPEESSLTLSGAVKAEQSGKFEDAHVSICKRYFKDGNLLRFSNATSLLKFTLRRTDIMYLTFSADDGTKIHGNGKLHVSFNGDKASFGYADDDGGSTIRVDTGGAGNFYISTLPCLIKGFSIRCFDTNGDCLGEAESGKTIVLEPKDIKDLGTIDSRIKPTTPEDISSGVTVDILEPVSETIDI